jgi:hypothetical protein
MSRRQSHAHESLWAEHCDLFYSIIFLRVGTGRWSSLVMTPVSHTGSREFNSPPAHSHYY